MSTKIDFSMNNVHKNECLKMIKILNYNLKNAEKEQKSSLALRKNEKDFESIYETCITDDLNLKKEKQDQIERIRKIRHLIDVFRCQPKQIKNPTENMIEQLKRQMDEIDSTLTEFKKANFAACESLDHEEKILSREVEVYDSKITNWLKNGANSDRPQTTTANVSLLNEKLSQSELIKEVVDFDKFLLANGGHNGGWDEIDHNLFLKIRNKYKGDRSFIEELTGMIATKTRDEIEKHDDWYRNYLNLNELKKQAIKDWKEKKKANQNQAVNLVDEELKLNQEIEKELRHRFEKRRELEKQQLNKKLNEWKIEKEIQKAQEAEKKKKEEEKRREIELLKLEKQDELREKIAEYRRQKEELNSYIEMEQAVYEEVERRVKSKQAKEEIVAFQERDAAALKERQERERARQAERELKQRRLEQTKERIEVESDPTRLYQPTTSWRTRLNTPRSNESGRKSARDAPIIQPSLVQHFAVPSWRQGI